MPFITPLQHFKVRWISTKRMVLEEPLEFRSHKTGHLYRVPKGFDTDLASVPRALASLAADWRKTARPGALHDWAYRPGAHPYKVLRPISRREADMLFHEALRSEGVGRIRAFLMWSAVRLFGASSYHARRRVSKAKI